MKELADNRTPWHRGLWQPGSVVLIAEVREAVEATWQGALTSDEAMRDVIDGAIRQISRDPGLGSEAVRTQLTDLLKQLKPVGNAKSKATPETQQILDRVAAYIDRCRSNYMLRWIEHIDGPGIAADEVELASRLLVAHLLDEGFHRSHVHGWLRSVAPSWSLSKTISKGREMLLDNPREFKFLVSLIRAPREIAEAFGEKWKTGQEYIDALATSANPPSPMPRAAAGALEWSCVSRDPHAAISELLAWEQRILARAELGYGNSSKIEFGADVVDLGSNRVRSLREDLRSIRVPAIQRSRVYGMSSPYAPQLDGAIGLLASHSGPLAGPSVASVWAAAEGLLGRPGGKGVDVADRLADIVACSFPRAELGELAKVWADEGSDALASTLKSGSSAEQARALSDHLIAHGDPGFSQPADRAAVARYLQLTTDPSEVIGRVRTYSSSVFRRLYYQRNFIMHAAKFDSVTLNISARTAPFLVAAGLDRIVNAQHGDSSVGPLDLAARAENEIGLLGTAGAKPLHLLLD